MSQFKSEAPLSQDRAGTLRVKGTRVSLDSIIYAFREGATPEEIVRRYPSLDLRDVHAVTNYYLQNLVEVEDYLNQRQAEGRKIKTELESRSNPHDIRKRPTSRE